MYDEISKKSLSKVKELFNQTQSIYNVKMFFAEVKGRKRNTDYTTEQKLNLKVHRII